MMKRYLIPLALLPVLALAACSAASTSQATNAPESAYRKITAEDTKALIDGGDEVVIVDVRTQAEYDEGHIPSAILVSNETISDSQPDALPDLDAKLIVYCRTGVRSKAASEKLVRIGYTDINDMGGIRDWPYDTITD